MVTGTDGVAPYPPTDGKPFDRQLLAQSLGLPKLAREDAALRRHYPFSSRLFSSPGGLYHYIDEGKGETVVMLHGNPTWSFFYRRLVKDLSPRFRCLVPDHLGCGLSEKPADPGCFTLEKHIDNLEAWLAAVAPPAGNGPDLNLVVHDWGGPIGLGYALRHPGRIRRLVVFNTSVFTRGDLSWRIKICRFPWLGDFLVRDLNLFVLGAGRLTVKTPLTPEVRRLFALPYSNRAARVGVAGFIRDIPFDRDSPTGQLLGKIDQSVHPAFHDIPVLIQWGSQDWCFTPFFLELWRERLPQAEVDVYPAGHLLLEDAGEDISRRVSSFLAGPR
ncbi:MAG: alpha/beta fold hydrolase [Planctomycetota bacterium]|jgi:haloalkane dehalogenase|nr:alpha/beta fold hydrolase [Planctomycetota bacterium]